MEYEELITETFLTATSKKKQQMC